VFAERDHARDAGFSGATFQMSELRDVAIDHRRAVPLHTEEDLGLGIGDFAERAEKLQMHRRDGGDDRRMRAREPRQGLDLARVVHAHFQHAIARGLRAARERQRHTPMIIVGRDRGVRFAVSRQ